MNRLKTVEVHKRNGVELGTPEVTTYDYTKVGSRASVFLPNEIQYDSLNRLTNLTHKKADSLIARICLQHTRVFEGKFRIIEAYSIKWKK